MLWPSTSLQFVLLSRAPRLGLDYVDAARSPELALLVDAQPPTCHRRRPRSPSSARQPLKLIARINALNIEGVVASLRRALDAADDAIADAEIGKLSRRRAARWPTCGRRAAACAAPSSARIWERSSGAWTQPSTRSRPWRAAPTSPWANATATWRADPAPLGDGRQPGGGGTSRASLRALTGADTADDAVSDAELGKLAEEARRTLADLRETSRSLRVRIERADLGEIQRRLDATLDRIEVRHAAPTSPSEKRTSRSAS